VEPVPFLFEKLKQNYGHDPRFRFENAAIAEESGAVDFYFLSEDARRSMPELPVYYDQLGSFNKSHIAAHFPGIAESMIVTTRVPALTFPQLLANHGIRHFDLLVLDTEGQDWAILRQLDLGQMRPRNILLEHLHLRFEERVDAMSALSRYYTVQTLEGNWLCQRADPEA
jgi:FkbM family methyltransferase